MLGGVTRASGRSGGDAVVEGVRAVGMGQDPEVRGQRSEVRGRRAEVGGRRAEGRIQKTESGMRWGGSVAQVANLLYRRVAVSNCDLR